MELRTQHQSEFSGFERVTGPPAALGKSWRPAPGSGHGREIHPWSLQTALPGASLSFTLSFEGESGQHPHCSHTLRDRCFLPSFALYFSNTVGACFSNLNFPSSKYCGFVRRANGVTPSLVNETTLGTPPKVGILFPFHGKNALSMEDGFLCCYCTERTISTNPSRKPELDFRVFVCV